MAKFCANASGDIIQFLASRENEQQFPTPPAGTVYTLQFDEETNAGVVAGYNANSAAFRMDGGTLTEDSIPVTINPPSLFYAAFQNAASMLAKAAGGAHSWTTEELDRLMAVAFRSAGLG